MFDERGLMIERMRHVESEKDMQKLLDIEETKQKEEETKQKDLESKIKDKETKIKDKESKIKELDTLDYALKDKLIDFKEYMQHK